MKTLLTLGLFLASLMAYSQFEANEKISILEPKQDDVYLAGENINVNAKVDGDLVVAGGNIIVTDTITQDLLAAAGEIKISGYIKDDIRTIGGTVIIDENVGDDVIIFGGEIYITKDAIIQGNLVCFSGDIKLDGIVKGMVKIYAGDIVNNGIIEKGAEIYTGKLTMNGEISGKVKLVAENIEIGDNAKFFDDVEYFTESRKVDFKNSMVTKQAIFNPDLVKKDKDFPWEFLGIAAISLWVFYILSAFLIILSINALFKNFFLKVVTFLDNNVLKSLGNGLIYVFGFPILIIFTFIILIGIPIGLFLMPLYIFSMVIGHLVFALLITHYMNKRNAYNWGFWKICFLALGIAIAIRLVSLIPFIGFIISIGVIAITYGLISLGLIKKNNIVIT